MSLALVKSAKAVSAQRLHDSNVDIGVVVPHEGFAVKLNETAKLFEIMFEQLLAQFRRQVGLGIVQKRSDVVLQRPFAAALIIHKIGIAVAQHHVPGLEIPVKKVIAGGAQQKLRQAAKIIFQGLFVEGDAGEPEKIIFEIIQIPGDGLAVEAGAWITNFVIQIAPGFDLKAWQHGHNLAIGFHRLGCDVLAGAVFREKLKERRVSQVFFEIGAVIQIFRVNLRHRQAVPAKMLGEFEESGVFFAHAIKNADGAHFFARKPYDLAPRPAELALQRLHPHGR